MRMALFGVCFNLCFWTLRIFQDRFVIVQDQKVTQNDMDDINMYQTTKQLQGKGRMHIVLDNKRASVDLVTIGTI